MRQRQAAHIPAGQKMMWQWQQQRSEASDVTNNRLSTGCQHPPAARCTERSPACLHRTQTYLPVLKLCSSRAPSAAPLSTRSSSGLQRTGG